VPGRISPLFAALVIAVVAVEVTADAVSAAESGVVLPTAVTVIGAGGGAGFPGVLGAVTVGTVTVAPIRTEVLLETTGADPATGSPVAVT